MMRMGDILENAAIDAWVRAFSRSPRQANAPHESDAELIEVEGLSDRYLAVTIDTVSEEVLLGIYRDPATIGWVTVMASFSDLAAVGADPVGLLVSASVPPTSGAPFAEAVARGMEDACRSLGVFVLGGDSNSSEQASFTGAAVGTVPKNDAMTRLGLAPGDSVFVTGPVGAGNALGLARLAGLPDDAFPESGYRPRARLAAGRVLRGRVHACMDTSDGLFTTLDQLMRLNGRGFLVECDWERLVSADALALCRRAGVPPWTMPAGPHGEFELVFAAPESEAGALADALRVSGLTPVRVGLVQEREALTLALPDGRRVDADMARARNLVEESAGDMTRYLDRFRGLGKEWGLE